ncbi:STAS domain-containing protein [Actinomadura sp. KC06]|uniref:STAS domain-containing protein n=1 Tax=Actinomadura sp. KC06 TaxID=2530369 RepID=UPI001A9F7816|nr:STAS domain-containing protein [Actinomadura sp. KC06]
MTRLVLEPLTGRPGLKVTGEINISNRTVWTGTLEKLASVKLAVAEPDIHLELSGLRMVDAGGAAAVAATAQRLTPRGRVVLHDPPPALCRILDLLWPEAAGIEVARR